MSLTRASCVVSFELPIGFGVVLVSVALPGVHFLLEGLLVGDTAAQALPGQNGELGFGHVEPASVLGREMPFEPFDEAARFGGGEGGIERGRAIGVEVCPEPARFSRRRGNAHRISL